MSTGRVAVKRQSFRVDENVCGEIRAEGGAEGTDEGMCWYDKGKEGRRECGVVAWRQEGYRDFERG